MPSWMAPAPAALIVTSEPLAGTTARLRAAPPSCGAREMRLSATLDGGEALRAPALRVLSDCGGHVALLGDAHELAWPLLPGVAIPTVLPLVGDAGVGPSSPSPPVGSRDSKDARSFLSTSPGLVRLTPPLRAIGEDAAASMACCCAAYGPP